MVERLWVLGALDPEMELIELLLKAANETFIAATKAGKRVHPGNAYAADDVEGATHFVECRSVNMPEGAVICDHHQEGDPGFGKPPSDFWLASSLGQVCEHIKFDTSRYGHMLYAAAADHCLGAAYKGQCPGIDPVGLGIWRAQSKAKFRGVPVETVLEDIKKTKRVIMASIDIELAPGILVKDMRRFPRGCIEIYGDEHRPEGWPYGHPSENKECPDCDHGEPVVELPEAATQMGIGYISGPLESPDGRRKITCSGTKEQVEAFMAWAPSNDIVGIYGDAVRGFAGGYLK